MYLLFILTQKENKIMEAFLDIIWIMDSIVTIVLKVLFIIAISIWIIFKKQI